MSDAPPTRSCGVTPRAVVLSIALAVFFGLVAPIVDLKLSNTYLGAQNLPIGAVGGLLLLLLVVNPFLKLLSRRAALSRNEILTVYITTLFSALVPGHGAESYFVSTCIGTFYFASPVNHWIQLIAPHLKPWLSPVLMAGHGRYSDAGRILAQGWFEKAPIVPWDAWLVPILAWSSLILATYLMWGCLAVLLRSQWTEKEALTFPLIRLPMEMTDAPDDKPGELGAFFRNRMMWLGFGIAVVIQGVNGVHRLYPAVPPIPMNFDITSQFVTPPLNQIDKFPVAIYPIAVGITYLLSNEVSFSLWFFFLFFQVQYVIAYYLGYAPSGLPTFIEWAGASPKTFAGYQQLGAYIVYAGSIFWAARGALRHILRRAFGRACADDDERRSPMSYPAAFWGFVCCFAFVMLWSVAAGIRFDIALAMWLFYLVCVVVMARLVVESGVLYTQQGFTPLGVFAQLTGSGHDTWFSGASVVPASFLQTTMMLDLRANLLPSFFNGFKLAQDRGIRLKPLLALIAVVVLVAYPLGIFQAVRLGYQSGGASFNGVFVGFPIATAMIAKQLTQPVAGTSPSNWFWIGVGALETWGIIVARSRFSGFWLHPVGMVLPLTNPLWCFWFSIFLGWMFKASITRTFGYRGFRAMLPAFLGLALGDIAMMLFWLVIDCSLGIRQHILLPG